MTKGRVKKRVRFRRIVRRPVRRKPRPRKRMALPGQLELPLWAKRTDQMTTIKCDWPGCRWITEHPFLDGWGACAAHGDIEFLPDPAVLCPRHAEAYEDHARNPWKLILI